MELNQALKILMVLAEGNMIQDPEMAEERAKQEEALESLELYMEELYNPSPLQLVIEMDSGLIQQITSNVPANVIIIYQDICSATEDKLRVLPAFGKDLVYVDQSSALCDPTFIAAVLGDVEATATGS